MSKILSLVVCFLFFHAAKAQSSTEITYSKTASHIGGIVADSIIVVAGSTYSFTVDTPEDKGLISTKPSIKQLLSELISSDNSFQTYKLTNENDNAKEEGEIETGDKLIVTSQDGKSRKVYHLAVRPLALSGQLRLEKEKVTANTTTNLTLYFTAGQRSPNTTVRIYLPGGIEVNGENTTVNVIGRGDVKLKDLATQSMGRLGTNYPYRKVGNFAVSKNPEGGSVLLFKHLDFRPANGPDLKIVISNVKLSKVGNYFFKAMYETKEPEVLKSAGVGTETATLTATQTISDFERVLDKSLQYKETPTTYTKINFRWNAVDASGIQLMQSLDEGKTWKASSVVVNTKNSTASVSGLQRNKLYTFKLSVKTGANKGFSNAVQFYSGKMDVKNFGVSGDGKEDATDKINEAIAYLNKIGGGTLLFSEGVYNVRTVHLQNNVFLYVTKGAIIKALKGGDAPEATWFSDKKYRSGLSPTDKGPYENPENWLTKQDVGHHYFRNTMFFGERLDNVKIIGNGRITGDGNLVTGDRVMNNAPDNRSDKMFTLKLCTNVEIGGLYRSEDLWYDEKKDEPYYITKTVAKDFGIDNMLHIDRAGHFVLLATGTDNINVHDTYFGKNNTSNVRDIYDFMQCNNVSATNIYCKVSSDDIVKPGSDCSLGYTRPAKKFRIRNIIGDTNCNLFQIGSETADDITDACVDNIYILGANKAGFSISTNDGAHVKDIHLNCGHTGKLHSRSKMLRTTTPFFISISNRGRVLGADVARFKFDDNGEKHDELLVTNVNIGEVENIIINGVDIAEVYSGSSYGDADKRWKPYDGKQKKATPIVAGYALPDASVVEGGLNFKLPNGKHTGYIKNIVFNDVHVLVKGGNPVSDTIASPPELGVGQYNVSNLKVQPAYGLWARHVMGLNVKNSTFNYEQKDNRYALFLDDVIGAKITDVKMVKPSDVGAVIRLKNASNVVIEKTTYFNDEWGKSPVTLPAITQTITSFAQGKASVASAKSEWVYLNEQGKLLYKTLPHGDKIMDFSYAGYGGGGVAIPFVPIKIEVSPIEGDNSDNIQNAISEVAKMKLVNGFRGAVLLKPGTYNCEKTININESGIVLRGSGSGEKGSVISMTGKPHLCVSVKGTVTSKTIGSSTLFADAYVPSGASSFTLADASTLNVGDTIRITRPTTDAWVKFMGMEQMVRDGKKQTWVYGDITCERIITKKEGNKITVDVPLTDSYDAQYLNPPGVSVVKITSSGELSQIGIENFRIVSPEQSVTITEGSNKAFTISGVSDAWAKNIEVFNTVNSVSVTGKKITVDSLTIIHSLPTIGAAKPADINGSGQQLLFNHCYIKGDNLFFFGTAGKVTGPVVLMNSIFDGNGWIQPHQRWATGLLIENCEVPDGGIDFMNRGSMGSGHGWTIGWAVAWNCKARSYLNQMPPGAANWVIGSIGQKQKRARPFDEEPLLPEGIYDAHGLPVAPASLYFAQLAERLGNNAVKNSSH